MKQILLGAVAGLALAAGLLGLQIPSVGGTDRILVDDSRSAQDPRAESLPPQEPPRIIASHDNSNTEEVRVGLNGNLISGRPTLVCTSSKDLFDDLKEAVDIWNEALQDSSVRPVAEARAEPSWRRSLR